MTTGAERDGHGPLEAVVERGFLEQRALVLELAAYLDRCDRAGGSGGAADPRLAALRDALGLLTDGRGERARRVLELWSDPAAGVADTVPDEPVRGVWRGAGG